MIPMRSKDIIKVELCTANASKKARKEITTIRTRSLLGDPTQCIMKRPKKVAETINSAEKVRYSAM